VNVAVLELSVSYTCILSVIVFQINLAERKFSNNTVPP